jgi:hypothetical protein
VRSCSSCGASCLWVQRVTVDLQSLASRSRSWGPSLVTALGQGYVWRTHAFSRNVLLAMLPERTAIDKQLTGDIQHHCFAAELKQCRASQHDWTVMYRNADRDLQSTHANLRRPARRLLPCRRRHGRIALLTVCKIVANCVRRTAARQVATVHFVRASAIGACPAAQQEAKPCCTQD